LQFVKFVNPGNSLVPARHAPAGAALYQSLHFARGGFYRSAICSARRESSLCRQRKRGPAFAGPRLVQSITAGTVRRGYCGMSPTMPSR
jgi:hypothetical protein